MATITASNVRASAPACAASDRKVAAPRSAMSSKTAAPAAAPLTTGNRKLQQKVRARPATRRGLQLRHPAPPSAPNARPARCRC